jgi:hypothetical protein
MHHEHHHKEDIEMIVNDDSKMEKIIKQEVRPDVKMQDQEKEKEKNLKPLKPISEKTKSEPVLSSHKPKIRGMAPMTPSLSTKLKVDMSMEKKKSPTKNHTAPLEDTPDEKMRSETPKTKTVNSSKSNKETKEKKRKRKSQ